jgi:hypothetical protein
MGLPNREKSEAVPVVAGGAAAGAPAPKVRKNGTLSLMESRRWGRGNNATSISRIVIELRVTPMLGLSCVPSYTTWWTISGRPHPSAHPPPSPAAARHSPHRRVIENKHRRRVRS